MGSGYLNPKNNIYHSLKKLDLFFLQTFRKTSSISSSSMPYCGISNTRQLAERQAVGNIALAASITLSGYRPHHTS